MATQTTEEAMTVLKATRMRHIRKAREIAIELIEEDGETHSRAVRDVMIARGELDTGIKDYWLGAVFRTKDFAWTGRYFLPPEPPPRKGKNIHAWRPCKIWTLADAQPEV